MAAMRCEHCEHKSGNLDTKEGREAMPIIESMIPWTEKIYDMTPEQIEEYKDTFRKSYHADGKQHEREVIDVFYMEYQYYQVRKTYDWVLEQYRMTGDKMEIRREILMQRLRGSNKCPISPEDIEYLISNMRRSETEIIIENKWVFKIYEHGAGIVAGHEKFFDENLPYIVGIDPASGSGGDNFAIEIINPFNLQIAAEFKSPYLSGPAACRMLNILIQDYIPRAVLVIEKNNMGLTILQFALETPIKDNFYWSNKAGRELTAIAEESPKDWELKSMAEQYKKYGHWTGSNRNHMFELLFQHVNECKQILTCEYLVNDMCKLIKTPTGKYQADNGEHDDNVMAYLIAIYTYYTGDNLELFGITRTANPVLSAPLDESVETKLADSRMEEFYQNNHNETYEEFAMRDAARIEEQTKQLVDRFAFMHDSTYSKMKVQQNSKPYDDTVDIGASFFDELNGNYDMW